MPFVHFKKAHLPWSFEVRRNANLRWYAFSAIHGKYDVAEVVPTGEPMRKLDLEQIDNAMRSKYALEIFGGSY